MDGKSFDMEGHFGPGMTDVAFSRVKTQNGLYLIGKRSSVAIDHRVINFLTAQGLTA